MIRVVCGHGILSPLIMGAFGRIGVLLDAMLF